MIIKKMLCAAGLAAVLLGGCASQQSQMEYIGASEAKSLALEACGMSASQVEFSSVDLSERDGQDYYRVELTALGEDYSYDIDALTGVIIDAKVPAGSVRNELYASGEEVQDSAGSKAGQDAGGTAAGLVTAKQAREKALAHAGFSDEQVTFLKTELDDDDGTKVYEVAFTATDGREYDYKIDVNTGDVISYDFDAESAMPPVSDGDNMISAQKAQELALAQVPGATQSDILEFETDHEDGRTQYEGKIVYEGMEYEFEIDAYSGAFRSWEAELFH